MTSASWGSESLPLSFPSELQPVRKPVTNTGLPAQHTRTPGWYMHLDIWRWVDSTSGRGSNLGSIPLLLPSNGSPRCLSSHRLTHQQLQAARANTALVPWPLPSAPYPLSPVVADVAYMSWGSRTQWSWWPGPLPLAPAVAPSFLQWGLHPSCEFPQQGQGLLIWGFRAGCQCEHQPQQPEAGVPVHP